MTGYFEVDAYGVPGRVLSLMDEFCGALGRMAALGALVELRMSDIVVQWGRETSDTGAFMQHLTGRIEELENRWCERSGASQEPAVPQRPLP